MGLSQAAARQLAHRSDKFSLTVRATIDTLFRHHRTRGALTMATKSKPKSSAAPKEKPAATKTKTETKSPTGPGMFTMPDAAQLAKYAKTLTPEQAFELYRANARLALDVIDAAIDSTAKMRKLQFEGEETARTIQRKAARHAAEADNV